MAFDEAADGVPGRLEDTNEFFCEAVFRLAHVAGGISHLHEMGFSGTVSSDEDIDAGRRAEFKCVEGGESSQVYNLDSHRSDRSQV